MSSNRRGVVFWVHAWLPVAVSVAIIALESTEYFGTNHTSGPLRWLFQALFGPINDTSWDRIHHYIRKSGHFLGYGAVGLAWLRAWRTTFPGFRFLANAMLAMLGTGLLASWDEWHQSFLPNRTSSPWDVLLDCSGALAMLGVAYIASHRFHRTPSMQRS